MLVEEQLQNHGVWKATQSAIEYRCPGTSWTILYALRVPAVKDRILPSPHRCTVNETSGETCLQSHL